MLWYDTGPYPSAGGRRSGLAAAAHPHRSASLVARSGDAVWWNRTAGGALATRPQARFRSMGDDGRAGSAQGVGRERSSGRSPNDQCGRRRRGERGGQPRRANEDGGHSGRSAHPEGDRHRAHRPLHLSRPEHARDVVRPAGGSCVRNQEPPRGQRGPAPAGALPRTHRRSSTSTRSVSPTWWPA